MSQAEVPPVSETASLHDRQGLRFYEAIGPFSRARFAELWRYRELLLVLAGRDLTVRYRQTLVGVAWVFLQPITNAGLFSLLFAVAQARVSNDGTPAFLILFAGQVPWQFFASSVLHATHSLVNNRHVITKIYFPRLLLPLTGLAVGGVEFLLLSAFLVVVSGIWLGGLPLVVVFLPVFGVLAALAAFAVGTWLSALNALYRDFGHVVPFLLNAGALVSTVYFDPRILGDKHPAIQFLCELNPMAVVISGVRWCVLGTPAPSLWPSLIAVSLVLALLASGLAFFHKVEGQLADRI